VPKPLLSPLPQQQVLLQTKLKQPSVIVLLPLMFLINMSYGLVIKRIIEPKYIYYDLLGNLRLLDNLNELFEAAG